MTSLVIRGDAARLPLPDGSVDLIVTSPPYYGLRSYTDGGEHYAGQIGSEATPAGYVAALIACTAEWVRVLKPSGSLFVNLGDKYGRSQTTNVPQTKSGTVRAYPDTVEAIGTPKCLLGLPWRYALAATDQLGLILRAEIIWAKPNGLPESVTDRVRRSHEQWFHLVRQPRYYSAVDEIREPHTGNAHPAGPRAAVTKWESGNGQTHRTGRTDLDQFNPLGKLPGSVWTIPSQPLTVPPELGVDHFAAFPMEWPRRIISGWSPPGICTACGEGRQPIADKSHLGGWRVGTTDVRQRGIGDAVGHGGEMVGAFHHRDVRVQIVGYSCGCSSIAGPAAENPDAWARPSEVPTTRPAVVLDPFGGTGTTALLAHTLGRTGITIDRSADYSRLAQWRTTDPGERARALQVDKPPPVIDGQLDLFASA